MKIRTMKITDYEKVYALWMSCKNMGFPRQEYWSGVPFPSPGDLPNPGIKPTSTALAGGFFTS